MCHDHPYHQYACLGWNKITEIQDMPPLLSSTTSRYAGNMNKSIWEISCLVIEKKIANKMFTPKIASCIMLNQGPDKPPHFHYSRLIDGVHQKTAYHQIIGHPNRWLHRGKTKDPRQNPTTNYYSVPLLFRFWVRGPTSQEEVKNWTCQLSNIMDNVNHGPASRGGHSPYAPVLYILVGNRHWRTTLTGWGRLTGHTFLIRLI